MHTILNQRIMLTISLRFQHTFQQKPWCLMYDIIWHETTRQLKTILIWLLCPYYDCDVSMKARSQGWSHPSLHCSCGPALQSFFHSHLSWKVFANLTDTAQTHSGLIVVIIFIFYPLLIIITIIIIISVKQQRSQAILLCVDRYFIWHQVEGSLNKISKPE